jgi:hypothetical protein
MLINHNLYTRYYGGVVCCLQLFEGTELLLSKAKTPDTAHR